MYNSSKRIKQFGNFEYTQTFKSRFSKYHPRNSTFSTLIVTFHTLQLISIASQKERLTRITLYFRKFRKHYFPKLITNDVNPSYFILHVLHTDIDFGTCIINVTRIDNMRKSTQMCWESICFLHIRIFRFYSQHKFKSTVFHPATVRHHSFSLYSLHRFKWWIFEVCKRCKSSMRWMKRCRQWSLAYIAMSKAWKYRIAQKKGDMNSPFVRFITFFQISNHWDIFFIGIYKKCSLLGLDFVLQGKFTDYSWVVWKILLFVVCLNFT